MNYLATLRAAKNERVLWNLRNGADSVAALLRRTSNGLELRYSYNGTPGPKLIYWNAVQLVNDAEDLHAELLAAGERADLALGACADG